MGEDLVLVLDEKNKKVISLPYPEIFRAKFPNPFPFIYTKILIFPSQNS